MAGVKTFPSITGGLTPIEVRKQLAGLVVQNADGTVRSGVISPRRTLVTNRATRQVAVEPLNVVRATDNGRGALLGANDAVELVDIDAAPGAGTSRLDIVWVRATDSGTGQADGDGSTVIGKTSGQPASANPQAPAIPNGAIPLASVLMPAGASTTQSAGVVITQLAPRTATAGSRVDLRSQAEQDAFAAPDGQLIRRMDTGVEFVREGTNWVPFASDWMDYTPAFAASDANPTLGNSTLTGRWKYVGRKLIEVRVHLVVGSTFAGGRGVWTFGLPSGILARGPEQIMTCKGYVAALEASFDGFASLASGATAIQPSLPRMPSQSATSQVRNTVSPATPGTGIPQVQTGYTWTTGASLIIQGTVEAL